MSEETCELSSLTILFSPLFATAFPQESNSVQANRPKASGSYISSVL